MAAKDENDVEQKMQAIMQKLKTPGAYSKKDLKELYELTGHAMRDSHGVTLEYNPCSVVSISAAVVKMARRIPAGKILNVGMGGYPVVDVELQKMGFFVTGVEYSFSLTQLAAQALKQANYPSRCLTADGTALPIKNEAYESCLCSETIEHIEDDGKVIQEIYRVLKPGGYLLLTVPCLLNLNGFQDRIRQYFKKKSWIVHPSHLREYNYFSVKKLIAGFFEVKEWHPVPFTEEPFDKMPYEKLLSWLLYLPFFKHFSTSIAVILRKV